MKDREHFLEPEVRDGVPVSAELKAVWKVLLDLLEILIHVCEKYGLHYALNGGSLLGAIRHRGFIPWDDDLDIQMPRKDFDRLIEVLPAELPTDVVLRTFENEPESAMAHLRLMNIGTTAIDIFFTNHKMCVAMGIHVDIEAIDGCPADEATRKRMIRKAGFIDGVVRHKYLRGKQTLKGKLQHWVAVVLYQILGRKRLFKWREDIFRNVDFEKEGLGATMAATYGFASHSLRKAEWFREYRDLPFEYLTVKVPRGAEQVLSQIYGPDWRTPRRNAGFHNDMLIDAHRKYTDVLQEQFGYPKEWLKNLP